MDRVAEQGQNSGLPASAWAVFVLLLAICGCFMCVHEMHTFFKWTPGPGSEVFNWVVLACPSAASKLTSGLSDYAAQLTQQSI